jgi:hypothetical protein
MRMLFSRAIGVSEGLAVTEGGFYDAVCPLAVREGGL